MSGLKICAIRVIFFTFKGNNSNQYCQKNKHYILDVSGSFIRRYGKGLRREFIFLS